MTARTPRLFAHRSRQLAQIALRSREHQASGLLMAVSWIYIRILPPNASEQAELIQAHLGQFLLDSVATLRYPRATPATLILL